MQALTHSSFFNESYNGKANGTLRQDNERFEFLGDAVIGLAIATRLMELFPEASEGKLSRWRGGLVSRKTLAEIAAKLHLGELILLGRGERHTGGAEKRSILAAALEAVIGAVYLDGGMEPSVQILRTLYDPLLLSLGESSHPHLIDNKTHLQEKTQSLYKVAPLYRMVDSWGPEHEKYFRVEIVIEGKVIAEGNGRSKKEAEQHAAFSALQTLGIDL